MKRFTFKGHHYIWRPRVLAVNLAKLGFILATDAFYVWAFLTMIGGQR